MVVIDETGKNLGVLSRAEAFKYSYSKRGGPRRLENAAQILRGNAFFHGRCFPCFFDQ